MKIGILTYHRAHNYGAVLQCYALKEVLRSLGHDVSVIDFRQPNIENMYTYHRFLPMRGIIALVFLKFGILKTYQERFKKLYFCYLKKKIFERFQKRHLNIETLFYNIIPQNKDVYIIGSDMLWADDCMQGYFEPVYFGNFKHKKTSRIIGYAISGSTSSFERLGEQFKFSFVSNFYSLSIRELSLATIVEKYLDREVKTCLDPTLLTTNNTWKPLLNTRWNDKKYILKYFLRLNDTEKRIIDQELIPYANERGMEIVDIDLSSNSRPITVEDFLSLINSSQHVVTDSFHGIIFSIIFHKSFQAIKMGDSHDARYIDILQKIGLTQTICSLDFKLSISNIDYFQVDERISEYRKASLDFLSSNI